MSYGCSQHLDDGNTLKDLNALRVLLIDNLEIPRPAFKFRQGKPAPSHYWIPEYSPASAWGAKLRYVDRFKERNLSADINQDAVYDGGERVRFLMSSGKPQTMITRLSSDLVLCPKTGKHEGVCAARTWGKTGCLALS